MFRAAMILTLILGVFIALAFAPRNISGQDGKSPKVDSSKLIALGKEPIPISSYAVNPDTGKVEWTIKDRRIGDMTLWRQAAFSDTQQVYTSAGAGDRHWVCDLRAKNAVHQRDWHRGSPLEPRWRYSKKHGDIRYAARKKDTPSIPFPKSVKTDLERFAFFEEKAQHLDWAKAFLFRNPKGQVLVAQVKAGNWVSDLWAKQSLPKGFSRWAATTTFYRAGDRLVRVSRCKENLKEEELSATRKRQYVVVVDAFDMKEGKAIAGMRWFKFLEEGKEEEKSDEFYESSPFFPKASEQAVGSGKILHLSNGKWGKTLELARGVAFPFAKAFADKDAPIAFGTKGAYEPCLQAVAAGQSEIYLLQEDASKSKKKRGSKKKPKDVTLALVNHEGSRQWSNEIKLVEGSRLLALPEGALMVSPREMRFWHKSDGKLQWHWKQDKKQKEPTFGAKRLLEVQTLEDNRAALLSYEYESGVADLYMLGHKKGSVKRVRVEAAVEESYIDREATLLIRQGFMLVVMNGRDGWSITVFKSKDGKRLQRWTRDNVNKK